MKLLRSKNSQDHPAPLEILWIIWSLVLYACISNLQRQRNTMWLFLSFCVSLSHIKKNIRFKFDFEIFMIWFITSCNISSYNWFFSSLLTTLRFFFYQTRANVKWKWRKSKIIFHEVIMIQRKNEGSQSCDLSSALGTGMSAVAIACTHW